MADNDNSIAAQKAAEKAARKKEQKRLAFSFLYADVGEKVLAQLKKDHSHTSVFGTEIAAKIGVKREDFATESEYKEQVIMPVMDAFLQQACPTVKNNAETARWVCNQYLTHRHNRRPIKAEDLYKIGKDISFFNGIRNSEDFAEPRKQLLQYKTYAEFLDVLEPYQQRKAEKDAEVEDRRMTPEKKKQILDETTILYDGPEGQVVVPHTPTASKYWGNNTKWCIAGKGHYENGEEYAETHFPDYNAKSPVIMMLPKGQTNNKIALVEHMLYDSADEIMIELPEPHVFLMKCCLDGLSERSRKGVELWMPEETESYRGNTASLDPDLLAQIKQELSRAEAGHGDPALWRNRDFVLAATQYDGAFAFRHAADELKQDTNFFLDAIHERTDVIRLATPDQMNDPEFMLAAVQRNSSVYIYIHNGFENDPRIVLAALEPDTLKYDGALRYDKVPEQLKNNRDIFLGAVKRDYMIFMDAPEEFRKDPEIVIEAVRQDGRMLSFVAEELLQDTKFVTRLMETLDNIPFEIGGDDASSANYQIKALERMVARGDIQTFQKYARLFKCTWGNADEVFAADPVVTLDKIKAEVMAQYPAVANGTAAPAKRLVI